MQLSKTKPRQQSVVGVLFYPAWKAGRVEWNEMEWNGFGASPPQTKKMSCIKYADGFPSNDF